LFTPLLYEVLTDELKPWEIAPSYRDLLSPYPIDHCQDWVERIDVHQQQVTLRQGSVLSYDYLVVATGSRLKPPATAGCHHAIPFTTLEDVWVLEKRLADLETTATEANPVHIVVTGAGPSGVELACKLADRLGRRGHLTVLDRRAVILRSHSLAIQRAAAKAMTKRGIEVLTNVAIAAVQADQVVYEHADRTHHRPADLVIWTVGTIPQPWLGMDIPKQSPLAQCLVKPTLQLPDYEHVFVLGDMAEMPAQGQSRAPMTAQAAYQAAPMVAHNLWASAHHRPLRPFHYHHMGNMLTLGKGEAVVHGLGLCLTGRWGAIARRWGYWLRFPTPHHRWRVLKHWLGFGERNTPAVVHPSELRSKKS
jgi:NADH dehydrogenase